MKSINQVLVTFISMSIVWLLPTAVVEGADIDSHAQVTFQRPDHIPIHPNAENGMLVNGPVANGELDSQFGHINREEVIKSVVQLPHVGLTYRRVKPYISLGTIIVLLFIVKKRRGKNYD
ncbi:hypothetical protein [Leuconostoc gelidum]|uniref:hypothetical protein n=1 Tax=Leuconostoc gelidum TaxID=1244 RepID=UPI001CC437E9|nr:hypothetical protein [Leuconostoc gelidum]MBZ5992317.1 hypothetical protein [Leuconostoc gelidum subsp. gelidum]USP16721.1 hypothetical protein J4766_06930 [Leuconostoc gelidum subsp. aenigmaticum]